MVEKIKTAKLEVAVKATGPYLKALEHAIVEGEQNVACLKALRTMATEAMTGAAVIPMNLTVADLGVEEEDKKTGS